MSEPHPNVLTYLAAIDAFNRNDLTDLGEYVRPDFVYRIPGHSRVAGEEHLIARARVTAERNGKRLDTENCYAFRFVDGKVADGQVFLSDPDHVDDFWGTT